jgi:N-acetylmuramoyl-L-alanine amidase
MRFHEFNQIDEAMPGWAKKGALALGAAGAIAGGSMLSQKKTEPAPAATVRPAPKPKDHPYLDYLAQTLWAEARGTETDMAAVGHVILNRLKSKPGSTIKDIVLQRNQFTSWNHDDPNFKKAKTMYNIDHMIDLKKSPDRDKTFDQWLKEIKNTGIWLEYKKWLISRDVARRLLRGELPDVTHGATNYYANTIDAPGWTKRMKKVAQIGRHIFFQDPRQMVDKKPKK